MLTVGVLVAIGIVIYVYVSKIVGGVLIGVVIGWWLLRLPGLLRRARVMAIASRDFGYEFSPTSFAAAGLIAVDDALKGKGYNDHELTALFIASIGTKPAEQVGVADMEKFREMARVTINRLFMSQAIDIIVWEKTEDYLTGKSPK